MIYFPCIKLNIVITGVKVYFLSIALVKRETGENPVRTRRCNGGALFLQL